MRKTTWNDYYERNVEKRDFSLIADISEECGKSRWIIECPFCGDKVTLYKWHPEKRCENCGAICTNVTCFKVKDK